MCIVNIPSPSVILESLNSIKFLFKTLGTKLPALAIVTTLSFADKKPDEIEQ